MKHARSDYNRIQDIEAARQLAELVLSLNMITDDVLAAQSLAREVLGITNYHTTQKSTVITTNGTTRIIHPDEPVFLIRGQDVVAGDAVRAWADLAEERGADQKMLEIAREQAAKMDAWPKKKIPDLPIEQDFARQRKYEEKLQAVTISFIALMVMFIAAVAWHLIEIVIDNL